MCVCGYDGKGYCPLFEGDAVVQNMISNAPKIYALSAGVCHTNNRISYECFVTMSSQNLAAYLAWIVNANLYLNNQ